MVGFHPINKTMAIGTILFIASMALIGLGALFHTAHIYGYLYLSFFFYGLGIFIVSAIILFIGRMIAAKTGKLQKRASEIWHNTGKKQ